MTGVASFTFVVGVRRGYEQQVMLSTLVERCWYHICKRAEM